MDERLEQIAELAQRNGAMRERTRILEILVKYKNAGWLDDALAVLLSEDICLEEEAE